MVFSDKKRGPKTRDIGFWGCKPPKMKNTEQLFLISDKWSHLASKIIQTTQIQEHADLPPTSYFVEGSKLYLEHYITKLKERKLIGLFIRFITLSKLIVK